MVGVVFFSEVDELVFCSLLAEVVDDFLSMPLVELAFLSLLVFEVDFLSLVASPLAETVPFNLLLLDDLDLLLVFMLEGFLGSICNDRYTKLYKK